MYSRLVLFVDCGSIHFRINLFQMMIEKIVRLVQLNNIEEALSSYQSAQREHLGIWWLIQH